MADEALAAADRADKAVSAGEPLGGPVTIKINVDYEGRPTTNDVMAFRDRIAKEDAPPVANWRTNVPAFCARFFTDNALHGRTLNPWAPGRTPGGSSGGAAAALACGIGPLAHGNDRAGSIRRRPMPAGSPASILRSAACRACNRASLSQRSSASFATCKGRSPAASQICASVAGRFREDVCFAAGEIIEAQCGPTPIWPG
jgi:hypothetical protein